MLVSIGRKRPPTDILDTILGCHARIRSHLGIAARLAATIEMQHDSIAEAAGRVVRYFSEALPMHTLDEDNSLLPRLLGRSPSLDKVLATMQEQHRQHEDDVGRLLSICEIIRTDPARLRELQQSLSAVVETLATSFEEHLTLEERVVFPAARGLISATEKASLTEEIRRRHRAPESARPTTVS